MRSESTVWINYFSCGSRFSCFLFFSRHQTETLCLFFKAIWLYLAVYLYKVCLYREKQRLRSIYGRVKPLIWWQTWSVTVFLYVFTRRVWPYSKLNRIDFCCPSFIWTRKALYTFSLFYISVNVNMALLLLGRKWCSLNKDAVFVYRWGVTLNLSSKVKLHKTLCQNIFISYRTIESFNNNHDLLY